MRRLALLRGGPLLCAAPLAAAALLATVSTVRADGNWVEGNAYDAVSLGTDVGGALMQPCLARDPAYPGEHPGKTRADWNSCSFGYGSREVFTTSYATLRPSWSRSPDAGIFFGREANSTRQAPCRGPYAGGVQVGKHIQGENGCLVPYGGQEVRLTNYEVLTQGGSFAVQAVAGPIAPASLVGGYDTDGRPLYPCRASFAGGLHLGKTRRDWADCRISYGGTERSVTPFETFQPVMTSGSDTAHMLRAGSEPQRSLGICRAEVNGTVQLGKWLFDSKTCNVGFGGLELVAAPGAKVEVLAVTMPWSNTGAQSSEPSNGGARQWGGQTKSEQGSKTGSQVGSAGQSRAAPNSNAPDKGNKAEQGNGVTGSSKGEKTRG